MILATHQPYFAPYPGFFHKIQRADACVLLDSVQFPQGTTWISRNRFKNNQGALWLTVPVWKKGLGLQAINEVRICHAGRWSRKHLDSLKHAYRHAPYFHDHFDFFEDLYSKRLDKLIDLNLAIIRYLVRQLAIRTEIRLLSEIGLQSRGSQLIVDLCRRLGASVYLAHPHARKYLNVATFEQQGVQIDFMTPPAKVYPQLWGDFIANLSTFDLLFTCGPKAREIALGN
jgi:WbqC-like protein family